MDLISIFNKVRDIPYKIPVKWEEESISCIGKSDKLYEILKTEGYEVRYRICAFKWSDMKLSSNIKNITHEDDCFHTYLEIKIDHDWKVLDATWDSKLKNLFHINEWDGKSSTKLVGKPLKVFSPEESKKIVEGRTKEGFIADRKRNAKFYQAFNEWLEENRV